MVFGTWKTDFDDTCPSCSRIFARRIFLLIPPPCTTKLYLILSASRGFWVGNLGFLGGYIARTHRLFFDFPLYKQTSHVGHRFSHVCQKYTCHRFWSFMLFMGVLLSWGPCDTKTLYTILVLYLQHIIVLYICPFGL